MGTGSEGLAAGGGGCGGGGVISDVVPDVLFLLPLILTTECVYAELTIGCGSPFNVCVGF